MKKNRLSVFITVLLAVFLGATAYSGETNATKPKAKPTQWPFYVYKDGYDRANHFSPTGWMGDFGAVKLIDKWLANPKSGKFSIRIEYTGKRTQGAGWAGIYWQEPALNWGAMDGGFDLTGAQTLYFWARGELGDERVEFKMGGIKGKNSDSTSLTTDTLSLTKEWKLYTINLSSYTLDNIIGGFCVVFTALGNPQGFIIYIDDIAYDTNSIETLKASIVNTNK